MFINFRKFDIISYFIISIISGLVGKRYIYGGIIFTYTLSLLLQKFMVNNKFTYKYSGITMLFPVCLLMSIILSSLFVLTKTTSVSGKQKLVSIVFLLLYFLFTIIKKYSSREIFQLTISKYIPTLLLIVVLFTVAFIPDNQQILLNQYNKYKYNSERF